MLIKDPSRFKIRNANSYDCVQLYQLVKRCYLELLHNCGQQENALKEIDLNRKTFNYKNDLNNQKDLNYKNDLNNQKDLNYNLSLDSFEEFVDCLGFGKRGEQRKVLDCLLIEDLKDNKIIALVTYSYGFFSYVGKEIHMNHFYVRPEYRLNGFGKFLLKNLIKLCAESNLYKLKYDG